MSSSSPAKCVFTLSILSVLLLWLSFPPIGWSFLAWVSLLPLIYLIADEKALTRKNYWQIWAAGFLYWLATFYFIPIPHPALWLGWLVISAYLACYLPLTVLSSRTLNRRFRLPLILAIPACWVGMELVRSYLFTGMGLVCLSHTQFLEPVFLQVCDLSGAYTLTFAIVTVATGIFLFGYCLASRRSIALTNLAIAALVFTAVIFYGQSKQAETLVDGDQKLKVALIQASIDTNLMSTEEEYIEFVEKKFQQYQQLNAEALSKWDFVDLVVWPENGWPVQDLHPDTDKSMMSASEIAVFQDYFVKAYASLFVRGKNMPRYLVGALTIDPVRRDSYGSAIYIDELGTLKNRYYKNHLVMFGEYVPLRDWFPLLQRIPAIGKGLVAGTEPVSIDIKNFKVSPSICFESTVPHYIRNQVNTLIEQGEEPDVLVNLTNDGWFYGTSCLDFHLACNVLRAVEMRKPHLVCANTGFSAHIDEKGNIVEQGPRRETDVILATVSKVNSKSLYRVIGDTIPIAFACISVLGILLGIFGGAQTPISND